MRVKRGSELNQVRQISIWRPGTFASGRRRGKDGNKRASAALGGDLAGELDLGLQGMIRRAAGIYVQRAGQRSQQGWRERRRGKKAPARPLGRRGARGHHQAAWGACSPPCAAPGLLHGDKAATEARNRRRRRKARVRGPGGARCRQGRFGRGT
jgi:hypothetical protein